MGRAQNSRDRAVTREVSAREADAPEAVTDEEPTRPIHTSLERSLKFEAARRQSARKDRDEDAEAIHRRPTVRRVVKGAK